jgi:hypothetical protein
MSQRSKLINVTSRLEKTSLPIGVPIVETDTIATDVAHVAAL